MSARMDEPMDICIDPRCTKLFFTDAWNNRIRMYDIASHHVSTIAGNGVSGNNFLQNTVSVKESQVSYPTGLDAR